MESKRNVDRQYAPHIVLAYQLQNLQVFLQVATDQSLSAAAKHLFMSPSAVSRCVHELEGVLGVNLFERSSSRGLLLNSHGELVLERARRIDIELRKAIPAITQSSANVDVLSPSVIRSILFSGRKLHLLTLLADSQRLSSAATRIAMTQAGASMSLVRIESGLGIKLFRREKHGLVPTEAANQIALRARRVFAEFRHMLSDISMSSGKQRGWVFIGTSPFARSLIVPAAVAKVLTKTPYVHVTMLETSLEHRLAALQCGDIDALIGLACNERNLSGIVFEPLFTDRSTILARSDHPLFCGPKRDLADLIDQKWILPWPSSESRVIFDAHCLSKGLRTPSASVESTDLAVIRELLLNSDMLALSSRSQFQFELRSGLLKELNILLPTMNRIVGLLTRECAMLSSAAITVLNAIRAEATRLERILAVKK